MKWLIVENFSKNHTIKKYVFVYLLKIKTKILVEVSDMIVIKNLQFCLPFEIPYFPCYFKKRELHSSLHLKWMIPLFTNHNSNTLDFSLTLNQKCINNCRVRDFTRRFQVRHDPALWRPMLDMPIGGDMWMTLEWQFIFSNICLGSCKCAKPPKS